MFDQNLVKPAARRCQTRRKVDINDLSVVLTNYDKTGWVGPWAISNNDGKSDINDLSVVLTTTTRAWDRPPPASGRARAGTFGCWPRLAGLCVLAVSGEGV